jgi:phage baseplate assembly protein gpV
MAHARISYPANTAINGGYCILVFTSNDDSNFVYLNTTYRIGAYTVPFDCKVIKVEAYSMYTSTANTVTVKQGTTNVCTGNLTLSGDNVVAGTLTTSTGVVVAAGTVLSGYLNTGSSYIASGIQINITLKIDGHPSWV